MIVNLTFDLDVGCESACDMAPPCGVYMCVMFQHGISNNEEVKAGTRNPDEHPFFTVYCHFQSWQHQSFKRLYVNNDKMLLFLLTEASLMKLLFANNQK